MLRIRRKKIFWISVAVFIFVVGLVAGSFLVLRSETSEGALFDSPDPSDISNISSSSNFLDDLKKFQEQNTTADGNNLTAKFLLALAQAGVDQGLAIEDYANPDFLSTAALPSLADLNFSIFPEVPDSDIRVSVKADERVYFENVKKYLLLIAGAWQEVLAADSTVTPAEREEYQNAVALLELIDQELRAADVPLKYRSTHGGVIKLNAAVKAVLEDGFLKRQDDPIRSLIVINQLNDVVVFGENLLGEIAAPENQND